MKHIKTPLTQGKVQVETVFDGTGREFCFCPDNLQAASKKAAAIVQAVNAHDALVAALKSFAVVATAIKRMPWGDLHPVWQFDDVVLTAGDFRRAAAALALAEGESGLL